MTTLHDLLDPEELAQMMTEKRIAKQVHPSLPLSIYNYTNRAQFMNKWTQSERVCRGLIVEDGTNKVIARGPEKFFNYGQTGAPEISLETPVTLTTKHDGSLGILWTYKGEYGVATRGSFTSKQAVHATAMLATWTPDIDYADERDMSRIVEIVYPENRIVLDYGTRDELIPIGTVSNRTGIIEYRPASVQVPYTKVVSSSYMMTLREALSMPIPADEEGYVLDIHGEGLKVTGHVKLKGEEYKILHGLLTNTNARRIWVQLAARDCHKYVAEVAAKNEKEIEKVWATYVGHDPEDFLRVKVDKDIVETLLTNVPDEFYDWVTKKIDSINDTVSDLIIQAISLAGQISLIGDKKTRYDLVKEHPLCKEILTFAEDREIGSIVLKAWKLAKPEGDDTPFRTDED